jgi:hypothetical protein
MFGMLRGRAGHAITGRTVFLHDILFLYRDIMFVMRSIMKNPATTNVLLLVIAMALIAIALKPLRQPPPAKAQTEMSGPFPVYIEPGTQMIRSPDGSQNVYGKMVVDMETGNVWGFPTLSSSPYPVDISSPKPPVSHAILLGTFAFGDLYK